jgi:hypothetical protein
MLPLHFDNLPSLQELVLKQTLVVQLLNHGLLCLNLAPKHGK